LAGDLAFLFRNWLFRSPLVIRGVLVLGPACKFIDDGFAILFFSAFGRCCLAFTFLHHTGAILMSFFFFGGLSSIDLFLHGVVFPRPHKSRLPTDQLPGAQSSFLLLFHWTGAFFPSPALCFSLSECNAPYFLGR